jgi:hypothetical protein
MKKIKKLLSALCAVCMIMTMTTSAFAAVSTSDNGNPGEYDEFTISFPSPAKSENKPSVMSVENINDENITTAQAYVQSLNLKNLGYQYIEDSCINQLETFKEDDDTVLTSYTVLVPKTRAATPTQYGTYKGKTFYSAEYSSYTKEFNKKSFSTKAKLQQWANATVNLTMCFVDARITVPFTIFSSLMGVNQYTIKDNAYIEYYFNLSARCRGIYVKNTLGEFQMVTSGEYGTAKPFTIFHPVDTSVGGAYVTNFNAKSVATRDFYNATIMMSDAYDWYTWGDSPTLYIKFTDYPPTIEWN